MSDLIDRQAAIDAALKGKVDEDESLVECPEECNAMIDGAVEDIKALPSAQLDYDLSGYSDKLWKAAYERGKAETKPDQLWIPVTERLPEDVELGVKYPTVIFCTEDATYTGYYEYHIGGLWWDEDGDNIIHGVIAWMPLPKPWKGEDDAEVH